MQTYSVVFIPSADKQLKKLPTNVQKRIVRAAERLANDPRPTGVEKMTGKDNLWRIRVGNYRVIYEIQDKQLIILVLRVAHRKDVYRGM